jgi:hypothetical protein
MRINFVILNRMFIANNSLGLPQGSYEISRKIWTYHGLTRDIHSTNSFVKKYIIL